MRSHGWSGNAPASDHEAVDRILDAVDAIITQGSTVRIADVARSVGTTRQTVYRYFPNTDAILIAVAMRSADGFLDRLEAHLRGVHRPTDAVVEAMAFTVESLAEDDRITFMLHLPGQASSQTTITSPTAVAAVRTMLRRLDIDWPTCGFDDAALSELAEFILRILYSYLVDRHAAPYDAQRLRQFLGRWIGPAVAFAQMAETVGGLITVADPTARRRVS